MTRKFLCLLACLFGAASPIATADAAYPDSPIRLIVPSGPGGITDIVARVLAATMSPIIHQSVVVENRAGASGVVGSAYVAHAKPDGYTLLMAFPSHVINPSTIKKLPYDTAKAFAPISKVGIVSEILMVANDSPARTMDAFVAEAKAKPGSFSYGSVGVGSLANLATLVMAAKTGIKMEHIPYPGEPEEIVALLRGDIQGVFLGPVTAIPLMTSGKARALAISNAGALPLLPKDIGAALPNYDVTGWNALFAPLGTPTEIIATLNTAVTKALADPDLIRKFTSQGIEPAACSPEALQKSVETDITAAAKVLKAAGVEPS